MGVGRPRAKKQHLKEWSSLLKTWTKAEQQKAVDKMAHLDAMEKVLREEEIAIDKLDQSTQELLEKAHEAHVEADKCISTYARLHEDLEQCVSIVSL
jgi:hypothetical protein